MTPRYLERKFLRRELGYLAWYFAIAWAAGVLGFLGWAATHTSSERASSEAWEQFKFQLAWLLMAFAALAALRFFVVWTVWAVADRRRRRRRAAGRGGG